jgi:putative FmdB family regulatory protein
MLEVLVGGLWLKRASIMSRYEYRCEKCGRNFERTEHISEHRTKGVRCPKCKSPKVTQVLGTFFAKTSKKS